MSTTGEWSKRKRLTGVTGNMEIMVLQPPSIEPNALERNKLASIDMLRDYIMTGRPPSPGKWVNQPMLTVTDNGDGTATINVSAGQADWDGILLDYQEATFTRPLPGAGLLRLDAVAASEEGAYYYQNGTDSQNPPTPPIPTGFLLANYVLLNASGGDVVEPTPAGVTLEQVLSLLGDYLRDYLPLSLSENLLLQLNGFFLDAVDNNGQSSSSYAMWNAQPYLNYTTKQGGRTFSFNFGRVAGDPYYEQYELAADGVTQIGTPYGIRWNSQLGGVEIYGNQFYVNGVAFTRGGDLPDNVLTSDDISTDTEDAAQDVKLITQGQAKLLGGGVALSPKWAHFTGDGITDTFQISDTVQAVWLVAYDGRIQDDGGAFQIDDTFITTSTVLPAGVRLSVFFIGGEAVPEEPQEPDEPDTTPPTAPTNVDVINVTQDTAKVTWEPATDDTVVAGYNIYLDGVKQN